MARLTYFFALFYALSAVCASTSNSTDAVPLPAYQINTELDLSFEQDMRDTHLIYDYDAQDSEGNPEKWRYELWFFSDKSVVYAIHGGPMAGRYNYQTAAYQCVRAGEIWQISWLEETGTTVSLVYDITKGTINGLLNFSKGHWNYPVLAHGDKRNQTDFDRWRGLAKIGTQVERYMLVERAYILESFKGKGELLPIDPDVATF
ncbi:Calycin-like protein [Thelonectria olida]|uniref:Calycin-like protein n=1 Tax=Thelonectria olida TaxID=1576542 RepID=A0A9P8VM75_9HYPO|nr:Calycin-like protein [Thelonectria olida]